jgi:PAS domain S-box-containing protein
MAGHRGAEREPSPGGASLTRPAAVASTGSDLERLLDSLLEAHVAIDAAGRVVGWNQEAERLLGWTRDEALGQEAAELFVPEDYRDAHRAGLARVQSTGRSQLAGKRLELVAVDRSGRRFPVELTIQVDPGVADVTRPPPAGTALFHGFLHDITEREHVHRQLHEREMFLRSVIDSLDIGVFACSADGRLVVTNQALRRAQAPRGHGAGGSLEVDDLSDAFHLYRADGQTVLPTEELPLVRALRGEDIDGVEMVMRPPDRAPVRYRVNGRRVHGLDGVVLGAVVELHDVTAEHQAELMRAGAAAFAMETAGHEIDDDSLQRGLSVLAGELQWHRVAYWVPGGAGHLDLEASWEPSETAHGWSSRLASDALERGDVAWREGGDREDGDREGGDREGRDTPWAGERFVAFPVTSGDRTIGVLEFADHGYAAPGPELVSLLLTVSAQIARHEERRRAEDLAEMLARERATFDRVLQQVDDHVWSIEIMPDGSVRSDYASPNVHSVFGQNLPAGEDPGQHIMDRMVPEDVPRFLDYVQRGRLGELADVEVRIRGFDDVVRWVWVRGVPRREGDRLFLDGISTDVTERRELQAERERLLQQAREQTERQLQQLHELDRMKDEFLATMSHELRNPVSVIQGYADLVVEDPSLPESVRSMMEVVRRRTTQLHDLVEELFAHARLEAGLVELQRTPVDLDVLVQELCRGHQPALEAAGLALTVRAGAGVEVPADEARLRQVLDNVVGNALKYTPRGGRIEVTTSVDGDEVVVQVADTGIGVPPAERPRLFEKLYRSTSAHEHGIEGTGLGLAVTKSLVEAHGGTVSAAANPGGGSVFTIRLPWREAGEA